ncbi:MAG: glycine--tRNA ligase subunit beta [Alphaproteobacteria bacterium]|nr:MAG: glycine--tRNA ligase subunit beta [Alphaproteobacteria bacterium]
MAEFLLELFSEEIPARMQVKAADDLKELVTKGLTEKGLTFKKAEAHSTPRRITLVVDGLPEQQPDTVTDKRGPRVDAPEQALQGFLKSINQKNFDKCVKEESPKGTFWFYRENVKGQPTPAVLVDLLTDALRKFTWPKSMRWAGNNFMWVRPIHSVLAMFNGEVLRSKNVTGFQIGKDSSINFGDFTQGHRFLSKGKITVSNFADYREKLKKAHVLLDRAERKVIISDQAQKLANKEGLKIREDEGLIEEIVGLVEWPVPLVGTFEKEYLDVPQEVLISTMRGNQKYIALLDDAGKLSNKFIVIANMITEDGGKQVVAGNEKVLRARLSDAKFYWDQDRRQKLESRNAALEHITFHQKLGTVKERVVRLQAMAKEIAYLLNWGNEAALVQRAGLLCKADLSTGVVFQFPEVQGTMGRYYALHDKEDPAVALAIAEHYKPAGAHDTCPTAPVSICVALADKIDALVGFFAIDEKPTGSKDPFALRRAALGVIRIILENKLNISLKALFEASYELYEARLKGLRSKPDVSKDLMQFFTERLKVALRDQGVRHDLIDAVLAANAEIDKFTETHALILALKDFLATDNGANLITAYKRGANILRIEEKKDAKRYGGDVNIEMLSEQPEKDLVVALTQTSNRMKVCVDKKDFIGCMNAMSEMRKPVDTFFEKIMVNAPDPKLRINRLQLLGLLRETMNPIAEFSKIEG